MSYGNIFLITILIGCVLYLFSNKKGLKVDTVSNDDISETVKIVKKLVEISEEYNVSYGYSKTFGQFTTNDCCHFYNMLVNSIQNSEYMSENDKKYFITSLSRLESNLSIYNFKLIIYSIVFNKGSELLDGNI